MLSVAAHPRGQADEWGACGEPGAIARRSRSDSGTPRTMEKKSETKQTVYSVIVTTDEFLGGATPRDVYTTRDCGMALDRYLRQCGQRIRAHTHAKEHEIDTETFKMCCLRSEDGTFTGITFIRHQIE